MENLPLLVKYILTGLIGMVPIVELRGAIPIGVFTFHLNYLESFICSFIGNIIPVYFIVTGEAWNKRTLLFIGFILIAIVFAGKFTNIFNLDLYISKASISVLFINTSIITITSSQDCDLLNSFNLPIKYIFSFIPSSFDKLINNLGILFLSNTSKYLDSNSTLFV